MGRIDSPRKSERRSYLAEVALRIGDGPDRPAHLLDLGRRGAGLFAPSAVPIGEWVELAIGPAVLSGIVAWVRVEPDGNFLGIAFARTLSPEQVRGLVTPGSGAQPPRDSAGTGPRVESRPGTLGRSTDPPSRAAR